MTQKRILLGVNIIMIGTCRRRKTGMQIICYPFHSVDTDIRRQDPVQFLRQHFGVKRYFSVEMCRHLTGMHPGIRPSSSRHTDVLS